MKSHIITLFIIFSLFNNVRCHRVDEDNQNGTTKLQPQTKIEDKVISILHLLKPNPATLQALSWSQSHPNSAKLQITNAAGRPLPSNTASFTVSNRGPLLFDPVLLDKLSTLNRERIPPRLVHAAGLGAFGHFTVTKDVSQWTKAKVFNGIGKRTKVFVRFSSTFSDPGTPDTFRDPRGFAVKMYTEEGNLDLTGCNIESFLVRDPMLFADIAHSSKRNPHTHLFSQSSLWDFFSLRPETAHRVICRYGCTRSMNGSAANIYRCVNEEGVHILCKFTWLTHQSDIPNLSDLETYLIGMLFPDFYTQDLYNAIEERRYPRWTLGLQFMTEEQAASLSFNPFDVTKSWRLDEFPLIEIGMLELNKNPSNYFAEVEQAAFCPGNVVPGIELEPRDTVLMARAFAYKDSQRHRLGPNFELIEVNRPIAGVASYKRDGPIRVSATANGEGGPNYFPNSFNGPATILNSTKNDVPKILVNGTSQRVDTADEDNFSQARKFLYSDISGEERNRIAFRMAVALSTSHTPKTVVTRVLQRFAYPLGQDFGDSVVANLRLVESMSSILMNTGMSSKINSSN